MARRPVTWEQIEVQRRQRDAETRELKAREARELKAREAREREENTPLSAMIVLRVSASLAMWLSSQGKRYKTTPSAIARQLLREAMLRDRAATTYRERGGH